MEMNQLMTATTMITNRHRRGQETTGHVVVEMILSWQHPCHHILRLQKNRVKNFSADRPTQK
jgi:hypothetical protein